jgi:D-sedoheptulose 7-phosphate isomerase
MDQSSVIRKNLQNAIDLKAKILADDQMISLTDTLAQLITDAFRNGKKVLFCGNGGSAADAQHLAAELSGRYYYDRPPLFSEALHVNTSYLTAVANDYAYDQIYARLLKAMGTPGDILIGLSTSGNSGNVINALIQAKEIGVTTIGFTGAGGGKMKDLCDYLVAIPDTDTPRIQECHMLLGHTICEIVERNLFPR